MKERSDNNLSVGMRTVTVKNHLEVLHQEGKREITELLIEDKSREEQSLGLDSMSRTNLLLVVAEGRAARNSNSG